MRIVIDDIVGIDETINDMPPMVLTKIKLSSTLLLVTTLTTLMHDDTDDINDID